MNMLLNLLLISSTQLSAAPTSYDSQPKILTGATLKNLIVGINLIWPQSGTGGNFQLIFMSNGEMLSVGDYSAKGSYRVLDSQVCYRLAEYETCFEVSRLSPRRYKLKQQVGRKVVYTIVTANK